MNVNQIYTIVNEAAAQSLGTSAVAAQNLQGLISLGDAVLTSNTNTELFLNSLVQRIGKTVLSFRPYRNKYDDMILNDFEYGAILQKVKARMPSVEADEMYGLTDGKSVDMYKVRKPKVNQKLFVTETPYQIVVTIQEDLLREAFLSESSMAGFISIIFGEVQNKLELSLENLGRLCIANYIAETTRERKLVTEYNATLPTAATKVTAASALTDSAFLRWALSEIKTTIMAMEEMSTQFNNGTETRHTPNELLRIRVLSRFQTALETSVQYEAFNERYVKLDGYRMINFWQGQETPGKIMVNRASDGVEKTVNNIVMVMYDRDALGIYKKYSRTATTPLNAGGMYRNTFWHEKQLWFNDLSENFVLWTLN